MRLAAVSIAVAFSIAAVSAAPVATTQHTDVRRDMRPSERALPDGMVNWIPQPEDLTPKILPLMEGEQPEENGAADDEQSKEHEDNDKEDEGKDEGDECADGDDDTEGKHKTTPTPDDFHAEAPPTSPKPQKLSNGMIKCPNGRTVKDSGEFPCEFPDDIPLEVDTTTN